MKYELDLSERDAQTLIDQLHHASERMRAEGSRADLPQAFGLKGIANDLAQQKEEHRNTAVIRREAFYWDLRTTHAELSEPGKPVDIGQGFELNFDEFNNVTISIEDERGEGRETIYKKNQETAGLTGSGEGHMDTLSRSGKEAIEQINRDVGQRLEDRELGDEFTGESLKERVDNDLQVLKETNERLSGDSRGGGAKARQQAPDFYKQVEGAVLHLGKSDGYGFNELGLSDGYSIVSSDGEISVSREDPEFGKSLRYVNDRGDVVLDKLTPAEKSAICVDIDGLGSEKDTPSEAIQRLNKASERINQIAADTLDKYPLLQGPDESQKVDSAPLNGSPLPDLPELFETADRIMSDPIYAEASPQSARGTRIPDGYHSSPAALEALLDSKGIYPQQNLSVPDLSPLASPAELAAKRQAADLSFFDAVESVVQTYGKEQFGVATLEVDGYAMAALDGKVTIAKEDEHGNSNVIYAQSRETAQEPGSGTHHLDRLDGNAKLAVLRQIGEVGKDQALKLSSPSRTSQDEGLGVA